MAWCFTRITRSQFEAAGLGEAIESHCVICSDEMLENVDAEEFQQRLWNMFPMPSGGAMTPAAAGPGALDHVSRSAGAGRRPALFDEPQDADELPDLMRVMDLQQEQLARSLGDGHRVIHGVAGSGKTMILGYRAEYLAQADRSGQAGAGALLQRAAGR